MDYKNTLLMSKSNFEMRGNLPLKEPIIIKKWQDEKLYENMNLNRKDAKEFILHDGPPYANGDIHCGHMLNRILKDFVLRYKNMSGFFTPFTFGWDTHGLPIENQVTKSGVNRKTTPIVEFRQKCEEYALKQVDKQKEEIARLGVLGDFAHPYLTLQKEYEASQIECFALMALKGLIYKGLKPVYWSPSSESALAEAEIEYHDVTSHSIYVAFPIKDGKNILPNDAKVIIWTTTPWTIPSNLAISAHPDFIYGLYETDKGKFLFLKEFLNSLCEELDFHNVKLIKEIKGQELEGIICKHPFYDRDSILITGNHVTNDAGTGLVHTAPGHGVEDYIVCQKYPHLKPYCPVDSRGFYDESVGPRLQGLFYEKANDEVLKILKENNALLKHKTFIHAYPHDWRTGKPLIFRATSQWFCSITPIKEDLLKLVNETSWYPSWGKGRMLNMIKDRNDWCISRQRVWGVPLPIIYNEDGSPIIEREVFDHIIDLFRKYGSNVWYSKTANELLPLGYKNPLSPHDKFVKEVDIMDVWFDSGSSFNSVIKKRGHNYPYDLCLEGSDQFRGWFNSSLIVSHASFNKAPYKNVVAHGWVLDEKGEQMHKSKGNGVDPLKIANIYGADILRLWTAFVDYTQDVKIGENLIKQIGEQYRKIRNTLKFISWNISDFNPLEKVKDYSLIDTYILASLEKLSNNVIYYFDNYNFEHAISSIISFMSVDLSSFYLDIAKDILYCEHKTSFRRKQVQSVLYEVGETLLRLLNPILPFTMEEFNVNLPGKRLSSSQLYDFPKIENNYSEEIINEYKNILKVRSDVLKALEKARNEKLIGSSQEAHIYLSIKDENIKESLKKLSNEELKNFFVVSDVTFSDNENKDDYLISKIKVKRHEGSFCSRCWNYSYHGIKQDDGTYLCPRCNEVMKRYGK